MNTRKIKRMLLINFTLVLSLVLAAQASHADVFKYEFKATVTDVNGPWSPCGISDEHNDTLSGTITFDTEVLDIDEKEQPFPDFHYYIQFFTGQEFYIK